MQDRERHVVVRPHDHLARKQRPGRRGGARKEAFALAVSGGRHEPLEELADNPKGEGLLELGAARPQDFAAAGLRSVARGAEERRLADPGAPLHQHGPTTVHHRGDGRQLTLALQQRHGATVGESRHCASGSGYSNQPLALGKRMTRWALIAVIGPRARDQVRIGSWPFDP